MARIPPVGKHSSKLTVVAGADRWRLCHTNRDQCRQRSTVRIPSKSFRQKIILRPSYRIFICEGTILACLTVLTCSLCVEGERINDVISVRRTLNLGVIRTEAAWVKNLVHFPSTIFIGGLVLVQLNLNEWLPLLTYIKVNQPHYRPGVAQRVPGS